MNSVIFKKEEIQPGKEILLKVVSMLVGLIKSNSLDRVYEERPTYGTDYEYEYK